MKSTTETSFLATRRGKLTLALLCAVAFLDFVDASIVNIALPSIRRALHFSEDDLQWVPSAYLLTYGGFMLLGGRAADLLGRRRVLVAGVVRRRQRSRLPALDAESQRGVLQFGLQRGKLHRELPEHLRVRVSVSQVALHAL